MNTKSTNSHSLVNARIKESVQRNQADEHNSAGEPAGAGTAEPVDQYLTFFMGDEEFGINILSVQEIRGWEPITDIPNSPGQVLGVMNLRGTVSPIIDLRYCFGIKQLSYTEQTVVIIVSVSVKNDKKPKIMGIVVDAVSDVYNFAASDIQASPELSHTHQAQYVRGLASTSEKMVIILDLTAQLIEDIS
jgi:purine-binding chemotaxis protein CheW